MRVDRLLWFLRFAKSRTKAQKWIGEGHIRVNGERLTRADMRIRVGDVLTLPLASKVAIVEVVAMPQRRGPPAEARGCYERLDAQGGFDQQKRRTAHSARDLPA